MPDWKDREYWSKDYNGVSEPKDELEERTRQAETIRDSLTGKDPEDWNKGTHGFYDCDHSTRAEALAWEHTDVDAPLPETVVDALLGMNSKLQDGSYEA